MLGRSPDHSAQPVLKERLFGRRLLRISATGSPSPESSANDAYQVDLVVTFFSVLLILLLVSAVRIQSDPSPESKIAYRPADKQRSLFQLRSLAALYPFRDVWLAKDGTLTRLDLSGLAKRYAEAPGPELVEIHDEVIVELKPHPTDIDGFYLEIAFPDTPSGTPPGLGTDSVSLEDAETALAAIAARSRGSLIYAWPDQLPALVPIINQLRETGACYKLSLVDPSPELNTLSLGRSYGLFTDETVLRCY